MSEAKRGSGRRLAGALAAIGAMAAAAAAFSAPATAVAPNPNPWLDRNFLNIAHQGGEDEAPSNTLYALKSAVRERGADMLELDVNLTQDGRLVVIHDDTVSRTTDGPQTRPASHVSNLTLSDVQSYDAGYWFRPGSYSHSAPAEEYLYRGIRTGAKPAPAGYAPRDFRIPTLEEVLDAFPTTPINIEIKMEKTLQNTGGSGCTGTAPNRYCDDVAASMDTATALAAVLDSPDYAWRNDIIVVSFSDVLIQEFHDQDDLPKVTLAPGTGDTFVFVLDQTNLFTPDPDVAAFQVPPGDNSFPGLNVPKQLLDPAPAGRNAHGRGYAVHVWPNSADPESPGAYDRAFKLGVDGYMASLPGELHKYLCANEVPRPDGTDRCPNPPAAQTKAKKCKKGKKLKKGKCVKKGKKRGKGKKRK
ncbi:MAG: glycerophosphodiester phosphodiesterase family protein [Solirubrobacterales bacterium]